MVAQVVAILALILAHGRTDGGMNYALYLTGQAGLWVVVGAALVSAADYFRRFNRRASSRIADLSVARGQRTGRKVG
jgi:hypothetical protein